MSCGLNTIALTLLTIVTVFCFCENISWLDVLFAQLTVWQPEKISFRYLAQLVCAIAAELARLTVSLFFALNLSWVGWLNWLKAVTAFCHQPDLASDIREAGSELALVCSSSIPLVVSLIGRLSFALGERWTPSQRQWCQLSVLFPVIALLAKQALFLLELSVLYETLTQLNKPIRICWNSDLGIHQIRQMDS